MFLSPTPFGSTVLDPGILKEDQKKCRKAGPCGVGKKALYLNSFYISRRFYAVYSDVSRVFKRVAMTSGGFTGKGMFGTMPYLVVVLKDGREKQCNFRSEEHVDTILGWIGEEHPEIPLVPAKAERNKEAGRPVQAAGTDREDGCPVQAAGTDREVGCPAQAAGTGREVQREIDRLRGDIAYLEKKPEIYENLRLSVRRKRTVDQMPKSSIWLVSAIAVLGAVGLLAGTVLMTQHVSFAPYLLLFGGAFLFLSLAARTLPVGGNSKKAAAANWKSALVASKEYISGRPGFSLPAQYADPIICERMIRVLKSGRALDRREALEAVKEELKGLNSDVRVSQEEYDEVVRVKGLFLECGYSNEV